eukprot:GHVN01106572.1.p1 GENE.GHVN01106572.1~~GHVN01106572.1.p1  ORF type:complete len:324 (-),score=25.52 GHVN01106572.1:831-1802(-)
MGVAKQRSRVPPVVLLTVFTFVTAVMGGALYNSNAVIAVWSSVGVMGWHTAQEAMAHYKQGLILFQSSDSFASPVIGVLLDNLGPKFTASLGCFIFIVSIIMIQIENAFAFLLACIMQGMIVQMVLSSTISIGNLVAFPSVAVALLSGGAEIAMATYLVIGYFGAEQYSYVMKIYVAIAIVCFALSVMMLPNNAFETLEEIETEPDDIEQNTSLLRGSADVSTDKGIGVEASASVNGPEPKAVELGSGPEPFLTQFASLQYWAFLCIFCVEILRQNFYLNNNGLVILPFCFIFALLAGVLSDMTSILTAVTTLNTCALPSVCV